MKREINICPVAQQIDQILASLHLITNRCQDEYVIGSLGAQGEVDTYVPTKDMWLIYYSPKAD